MASAYPRHVDTDPNCETDGTLRFAFVGGNWATDLVNAVLGGAGFWDPDINATSNNLRNTDGGTMVQMQRYGTGVYSSGSSLPSDVWEMRWEVLLPAPPSTGDVVGRTVCSSREILFDVQDLTAPGDRYAPDNPNRLVNLTATGAHEFGHALRLEHTGEFDSIYDNQSGPYKPIMSRAAGSPDLRRFSNDDLSHLSSRLETHTIQNSNASFEQSLLYRNSRSWVATGTGSLNRVAGGLNGSYAAQFDSNSINDASFKNMTRLLNVNCSSVAPRTFDATVALTVPTPNSTGTVLVQNLWRGVTYPTGSGDPGQPCGATNLNLDAAQPGSVFLLAGYWKASNVALPTGGWWYPTTSSTVVSGSPQPLSYDFMIQVNSAAVSGGAPVPVRYDNLRMRAY